MRMTTIYWKDFRELGVNQVWPKHYRRGFRNQTSFHFCHHEQFEMNCHTQHHATLCVCVDVSWLLGDYLVDLFVIDENLTSIEWLYYYIYRSQNNVLSVMCSREEEEDPQVSELDTLAGQEQSRSHKNVRFISLSLSTFLIYNEFGVECNNIGR